MIAEETRSRTEEIEHCPSLLADLRSSDRSTHDAGFTRRPAAGSALRGELMSRSAHQSFSHALAKFELPVARVACG